jgi:hypothetical protein
MYSVLSLLTGAVLIGSVYGLSFLPTATLARSDDEPGLGVSDDASTPDGGETDTKPSA